MEFILINEVVMWFINIIIIISSKNYLYAI